MDAYERVIVKKENPSSRDAELLCERVYEYELVQLREFVLQRFAELEAAPKGLAYCGTWQRAAKYWRHQGVTHKGQIWVVVVDETNAEPGAGGDWQLAQKGT